MNTSSGYALILTNKFLKTHNSVKNGFSVRKGDGKDTCDITDTTEIQLWPFLKIIECGILLWLIV